MTEAFWFSRDVLQHTLELARHRRVGPWAVLGVALARAVATIPPTVALPGIIGGRMSLNLFVALTGPSGGGKGAATATAMSGFTFGGPHVPIVPLGSGEGIARTFRPHGTKPEEPNPVTTAIFDCAEVDSYAALASRTGSTLSAESRKVYTGETIGFANASAATRNIVAAGSYRACQIVGVQPQRSAVLLGDADGGLPQRFVWLPTSDPDAPDDAPADPGPWTVKVPAWARPVKHLGVVGDQIDLVVPEVAVNAIRGHRLAVLREEPNVNALDGHALLTRLKVAAALMALDGRTVVDSNDWSLAGYVMDVSNWTRDRCQDALLDRSRRANTAKALATAERDEIVSERKQQRARDTVLRRLDGHGEQTRGELTRALKVDIRDHLDAALSELLDEGQIIVSPGVRGRQKVHVYHRYTPSNDGSSCDDSPCTESTRVPNGDSANVNLPTNHRRRDRNNDRRKQQTEEGATA